MKIDFSTRPFVLSHMREPHGTGSWAFEFEDSKEAWFAPGSLTLSQAKQAARVEVTKRAGAGGVATTVKILP